MATELSQDLVIPAYTDTELTVKKVEKGVDLLEASGFTKIAIDKFTFSSREPMYGKFLNHSLGKIPEFAIIFASDYKTHSVGSDLLCAMADIDTATNVTSVAVYELEVFALIPIRGRNYINGDINRLATADRIMFDSSSTGYYYGAGVVYTLITMA